MNAKRILCLFLLLALLLAACEEMSARLSVFQGLCAGEKELNVLWDTYDQEALDQGIDAIRKAKGEDE